MLGRKVKEVANEFRLIRPTQSLQHFYPIDKIPPQLLPKIRSGTVCGYVIGFIGPFVILCDKSRYLQLPLNQIEGMQVGGTVRHHLSAEETKI